MADGQVPARVSSECPGAHWTRLSPPPLGWSIDLLARAAAYSARIGSTAVIVVQHGRIVAEWGDTTRKSDIASVRKSLLSALIGIAAEHGRIRLADTLGALGIDDESAQAKGGST